MDPVVAVKSIFLEKKVLIKDFPLFIFSVGEDLLGVIELDKVIFSIKEMMPIYFRWFV